MTAGDQQEQAVSPFQRIPPHAVRHDVLPAADHAALIEWALANEARVVPSELGLAGTRRPAMRNSMSLQRRMGQSLRDMLGHHIGALLPGLIADLGMTPFALDRIEFDTVVYNEGAYYRRHIDTGTGDRRSPDGDRVVTVVYYFYHEPQGFSGGALRLHPIALGQNMPFLDFPPIQNGLVAFPSWAPHEVLPVRCPSGAFLDSRFAINCWMRRANSRDAQ